MISDTSWAAPLRLAAALAAVLAGPALAGQEHAHGQHGPAAQEHSKHDHSQHDHSQHDHSKHDHSKHDHARHHGDPHDHARHHQAGDDPSREPAALPAPGAARIDVPDTVLVDQEGRSRRLRSELMGQRLVVANFVYTTCTTVCPVMSALFADVQKRLGERAGRDVALLSVSVDPLRDTPRRLKDFSARYGAGPGWSFLTGERQAVEEVLKAFGAYTPSYADHPALVLVGDPKSGRWTRFFGFASPEQIMQTLGELQAAKAAPAHAH